MRLRSFRPSLEGLDMRVVPSCTGLDPMGAVIYPTTSTSIDPMGAVIYPVTSSTSLLTPCTPTVQ